MSGYINEVPEGFSSSSSIYRMPKTFFGLLSFSYIDFVFANFCSTKATVEFNYFVLLLDSSLYFVLLLDSSLLELEADLNVFSSFLIEI